MRARTLPALVLLLALVPLAAAQAQVQPGVAISLDAPRVEAAAGETVTVTATVRNDGPSGGQVAVRLRGLDAWSPRAEPADFALDAGASRAVTLVLVAPVDGGGALSGALGVEATLVDALGRSARAEATLAATRLAPPPPVPPPAWHERASTWWGAGFLLALGAGSATFAAVRRRRAFLARETGIALAPVDSPRAFGTRGETLHRVRVANESPVPRVAVVDVAERPDGWQASLSLARVALPPGASVLVSLVARPLPGAAASAGRIVVRARPEEARERDVRVAVEVAAPPDVASGLLAPPHPM